MKADTLFGADYLIKAGVGSKEEVIAVGAALRAFFLENGLFRNPKDIEARKPDGTFEFGMSDLNEAGMALAKSGLSNYFARFERNREADPFDTRVLKKHLLKNAGQTS